MRQSNIHLISFFLILFVRVAQSFISITKLTRVRSMSNFFTPISSPVASEFSPTLISKLSINKSERQLEYGQDDSSIMQKQNNNMIDPAKDTAIVALKAKDFEKFLTNPFLEIPLFLQMNQMRHKIKFIENSIFVEHRIGGSSMVFYFECLQGIWKCSLIRSTCHRNCFKVQVIFVGGSLSLNSGEISFVETELSQIISKFFHDKS